MRQLCFACWVGTLALCTTACGQDWPTYQGNLQRTGRTTAVVDIQRAQFLWDSGPGYSGARLVGDTIVAAYSGFDGDRVTAFDARTGAVRWSRDASPVIMAAPNITDGFVSYASGYQGGTTLEVVRLDTGQLLASASNLDATFASPMMRNLGGGLYDLTVSTVNGARKWTFDGANLVDGWEISLSNGGMSTPSMIGGSAIIAGVGHYYSVDMATGAFNEFSGGNISGGGGSAAAIDSTAGRIFIQEWSNQSFPALTAFQVGSQGSISQLWQIDVADAPSDPALTAGGNLVLVDSGRLFLVDGATGSVLDQTPDIGAFWQAPVLSEGLIWIGTNTGVEARYLSDLELAGSLPSLPGGGLSGDMNVVAMSGQYITTFSAFGGGYGREGLRVFAVPEPGLGLSCLVGVLAFVGMRRWPRSTSG